MSEMRLLSVLLACAILPHVLQAGVLTGSPAANETALATNTTELHPLYRQGFEAGRQEGLLIGVTKIHEEGNSTAYCQGVAAGYACGYACGLEEGKKLGATEFYNKFVKLPASVVGLIISLIGICYCCKRLYEACMEIGEQFGEKTPLIDAHPKKAVYS
ncbi:hypothetical protein M3Y99_01130600 [Aphelenchoides fujianensis]|nr:hypothetical protein M3Y99_01130600 [Aphelenchoides fujianensis]